MDRGRRPKPALGAVRRAFAEAPLPRRREWPRVAVVVCSYNGSRTIRRTCEGLLGLDYPDTQCGYKGYRRDVAQALFSRLEVTSFAFEVEILLRAQAAGYRVRRQPLHLLNDEDSSVRLTRHAPRMLLDVVRIAVNNRRGRYDRHA